MFDDLHDLFISSGDDNQDLARVITIALRAVELGWAPIPIVASQKMPWIKEWPTLLLTADTVPPLFWKHRHYHRSIGARTGRTGNGAVAFDIDLEFAPHVEILVRTIERILGVSPFFRVGSKGGVLVYFCADDIITRVIRTIPDGAGKRHPLIELLGNGRQFAAGGLHPVTQRPYRWLRQGAPWTMKIERGAGGHSPHDRRSDDRFANCSRRFGVLH